MEGGLKEILDRLDSLEEEGTDASPKTLYTMKRRQVESNSACLPAQAHRRSANTTPGIVAVDVSADDTRSKSNGKKGNEKSTQEQKKRC